nr:hypothetical protein [Tanacetum cinerariifolium]
KGFSGVETPLFECMLAVRDVAEEADDIQEHAAEEVAADGRNIVDMDRDEGIKLVTDQQKDAELSLPK